mgnify:CR=1 FL=1|tara:strand:- start:2014 stop:2307 length:294 start_codon:yes stop_codon:yes gene_type:complete
MGKNKNKKEVITVSEVVLHSLSNFTYGLLGASIIVSIKLGHDLPVLITYLMYYFFLGKVINRPKYVTNVGKFIVFPIPTAVGAFFGYKVAPILINLF